MWPDIKRENGIGIKFNEEFWDNWGPTNMCYFNPELFNDEKKIKSIYCMYLSYGCIKFKPEEIAMGLVYECGDFGQHTVLFSYEDIPNIEHAKIWDYCVFENLETEMPNLINLYNYNILKQQGKMSDEDIYINFLEDYIVGYDIDKEVFRNLCDNILKAYIKNNPSVTYDEAYKRFLENISERILGENEPYTFLKPIRDCCTENSDEFDKTILDIIKQTKIDKESPNKIRERFNKSLEMFEMSSVNNDLNSIFRNCRDLFLDKAIRYSSYETDEIIYDENDHKFVKTGNKIDAIKEIFGIVKKDNNGKAVFEETKWKEPERTSTSDFDDWTL